MKNFLTIPATCIKFKIDLHHTIMKYLDVDLPREYIQYTFNRFSSNLSTCINKTE